MILNRLLFPGTIWFTLWGDKVMISIKKRIVFFLEKHSWEKRASLDEIKSTNYRVHSLGNTKEYIDFLKAHIPANKLEKRVSHPDCKGFIAVDLMHGKPVAYYWAIEAKNCFWRDKFPVPAGAAMCFDAFVVPEHRGKGLHFLLKKAAFDYLFCNLGCSQVYNIVEERNSRSVQNNLSFGMGVYAKNYLVKFRGRNVFSVYVSRAKIKLYYVFRNEKGRNF